MKYNQNQYIFLKYTNLNSYKRENKELKIIIIFKGRVKDLIK